MESLTLEELKELVPRATEIASNPLAQVHWRGQKMIFGYDEDNEDIINSVRVNGCKLFRVDADGDPSTIKHELTATGIDAKDGRIYIAPTNHKPSKLNFVACRRKFARMTDAAVPPRVRVGVVYSEVNGIEGLDLGWYVTAGYSGYNNGSYLILEPETDEHAANEYPHVERIGMPTVVDGTVTNSLHEARFIAFLKSLSIPFLDETRLKPIVLSDGRGYAVDFMIYPDDPERQAYIELKRGRPMHDEIMKVGELHRETGVNVYLVWGDKWVAGLGVQNDKWDAQTGRMRTGDYENGIRAARVYTNDDGQVAWEGDYYFMANDRAGGLKWEKEDGTDDTTHQTTVLHDRVLMRRLARGLKTPGPRSAIHKRPIVRATTRVASSDGQRYRPVDVFQPHLFRYAPFAVDTPSSHLQAGANDWNSSRMRAAYKAARDFRPS